MSAFDNDPSGWTEEWDETYQRYYFYHAASNQSSWEKPEGVTLSEDAKEVLECCEAPPPLVEESTTIDDPSNWIVEWDDNYQSQFFFNVITNETRWERPVCLEIIQDLDQTTKEKIDTDKGNCEDESNWSVEWDSSYGREFYFNNVTQESTWEKPQCLMNKSNAVDEINVADKDSDNFDESMKLASACEIDEADKDSDNFDEGMKLASALSAIDVSAPKKASRKNSIKPRPSCRPDSSVLQKKSVLRRISTSIPPKNSPKKASRRQSTAPRPANLPPKPLFVREEFRREISNLYQKMSEQNSSRQIDEEEVICEAETVEECKSDTGHNVEQKDEDIKNFLKGASSQDTQGVKSVKDCLSQYEGITFNEFASDNFKSNKKGSLLTDFSWQKDLIKSALLKHANSNDEKLGVQMFKNVVSAMGDRSSSKKIDEHVHKIVSVALSSKSEMLQDEVYCQLCKQTSRNPKETSNILGWKLFLILLSCFPPSQGLYPYLMAFFCENVKAGTGLVPQYAEKCVESLQFVAEKGSRDKVPSLSEVMSLGAI